MTITEEGLQRQIEIRKHWSEDCKKWHGRVLNGVLAHYCYDWDDLPLDETCDEILTCTCDKWELAKQALEAGRCEV